MRMEDPIAAGCDLRGTAVGGAGTEDCEAAGKAVLARVGSGNGVAPGSSFIVLLHMAVS
jgi:hypothetical protein